MTDVVGTLGRIHAASSERAAAVKDVSAAPGRLDAITRETAVAAEAAASGNDALGESG
jgi:predicted fused transcriptional regulator/phosphomethylpyrimidine kinase